MAFLDNSGDIILDAVLTDTGRFRMARGDFKITKFALGDDEIDYSLFNRNHPSGSAYYDLEVLKTPILEAFTNNTSLMKSKLMTITNTNILHMPIMKLCDGGFQNSAPDLAPTKLANIGTYIITVDANTEDSDTSLVTANVDDSGIIHTNGSNYIALETGMDTKKVPPSLDLPANLRETQFIIEMDDRLGTLIGPPALGSDASLPVSFIDDDQIASYYISANSGMDAGGIIRDRFDTLNAALVRGNKTKHRIRGPRGKVLQFRVKPSLNLNTSTYLFEKLGSTFTQTSDNAPVVGLRNGKVYYYIDTFVRITAATTGYSIDIPIRYIKKQGTS